MKTEIFPAKQKNIEETPEFPGIVNFNQLESYRLHSVIHEYNNYFLRPALYSVFAKISSSFKAYYYDPNEKQEEEPAIRERPLTSSEIYDFKQDIKEYKKLYKKLLKLFDSMDNGMPFPLKCSKIIIEYYYIVYKIPLKLIGEITSTSINNTDITISPLQNLDYKHSPGGPGLELFDRMEPNEVYKKYNRFFYRTEINLIQSWTNSQLKKGTYFDYKYDPSVLPIKLGKKKGKSIKEAQFLKFLEESSEKFEKGQIAEYTPSSQITYRFRILNQESDFNDDPEVLWQLGVCCLNGSHGVQQNPEKAVCFFQQASMQGHVNALNSLAHCYYYGLGVVKDLNEAARLYRLAADKGSVLAQLNLGIFYKNGLGVERDHNEAVRLFRLAAEQKHSGARGFLADYYYRGEGGLEKDEKEAFRLFRLSANRENDLNNRRDKKSIKALIQLYRLGIGVMKDVNESRQWELILKQEEAFTATSSPNGGP